MGTETGMGLLYGVCIRFGGRVTGGTLTISIRDGIGFPVVVHTTSTRP